MEFKKTIHGLWKLARPSHWIKNIFVLAGVFFAEDWQKGDLWTNPLIHHAFLAFLGFCLAASAVYSFNDAMDIEDDRLHPLKCLRPLPAGELSTFVAFVFSAALILAAIALTLMAGPNLGIALGAYILVNLLYSRTLKHIVLVDVFCIAFGFIIRLLAGTWGIGIPPSEWFILCTMALSLFLGFSKRYAERMDERRPLAQKRPVLQSYSPEFLRVILGVTLSASLITYGLYTTNTQTVEFHRTENLIYSLPIAMFGMFRYLYLVMEKGYGENTIADILKDSTMIFICFLYVTCVALLLFFSHI